MSCVRARTIPCLCVPLTTLRHHVCVRGRVACVLQDPNSYVLDMAQSDMKHRGALADSNRDASAIVQQGGVARLRVCAQ